MKYSQFELLVLIVGGIAVIAATAVASLGALPVTEEVVAQALLLGVLVGAVHWGRNGGFVSAVVALLIYIFMRVPLALETGLTADLASLVVIRMVTYGLVGIVGGELCGRIKYVFARIEGAANLDESSRVFNQGFMLKLLDNDLSRHERYGSPFSIVLLDLAPSLFGDLRPSRQRSILRAIANHARNDVRLVDDVGRLDDGRFLLLLPQTPHEGGLIAADRVRAGVRDLLGARDESVTTEVLSAPKDLAEVKRMRDSMSGVAEASFGPASYPEAESAS